jgi:hypothetical protein
VNKLYTKAALLKFFCCRGEKHSEGCHERKERLREKNAQKRVLSRKKRNKVSENSPKTLVFVQVVVLMSKNKLNFHEMNNKKVLQSRPKYVIIHESDMRRSERLPPTGG